MRRVAAGDDAAMAELVQNWQEPVLSFVCRFLGCGREDALDLSQEAFLRVWRQRRRWRPTARFSTWLFTIVSNLCRNHRRTMSRRPELVPIKGDGCEDTTPDPPAPPSSSPHFRAEASQAAASIRAAVAHLPEQQRAALLLRRFGGMSYREIAAVLETTPSAVDSLLVRARHHLTQALAQEKELRGVQQR
jgi:RNA polymerase sigma-70 factor (ECF subfamily)